MCRLGVLATAHIRHACEMSFAMHGCVDLLGIVLSSAEFGGLVPQAGSVNLCLCACLGSTMIAGHVGHRPKY